jgi:large subunit ribosomal protein L19
MGVHPLIEKIESAQLRAEPLPKFKAGDTVRVHVKIRDGEKERIQDYEGVCIAINGQGNRKTFTVRKDASGFGVERVFPFHSPRVSGLAVVRRGRVRRAKLYYLRALRGRAARIREERKF